MNNKSSYFINKIFLLFLFVMIFSIVQRYFFQNIPEIIYPDVEKSKKTFIENKANLSTNIIHKLKVNGIFSEKSLELKNISND